MPVFQAILLPPAGHAASTPARVTHFHPTQTEWLRERHVVCATATPLQAVESIDRYNGHLLVSHYRSTCEAYMSRLPSDTPGDHSRPAGSPLPCYFCPVLICPARRTQYACQGESRNPRRWQLTQPSSGPFASTEKDRLVKLVNDEAPPLFV